ncbi:ankyrin repeat domain-containing protein [Chamaesiphon sp. VAR_69_metabat_338]|uniref:ankyrin repeat domain-containing protein n=1 Tax=Chamaesiphon sp. VAR_69_metabat_338 TaxID=2964704 RepID=UPI00286DF101|nr:ankyrin repeat domain-containing protein [Chamaesiphon sp. VAR_69_metabat_338]
MSVDHQTQSLFEAITAIDYHRVKLAIDSGAAINNPNDRGQTPLALACRQGNLDIVDLLVAAGAQMHPELDASPDRVGDETASGRSSLASVGSPGADTELTPPLTSGREIPFENLLDSLHQPADDRATQIEQLIPTEQSQSSPTANPPISLQQMAAQWPNLSSAAEDEATYTFDLDEVFAANESSNRSHNIVNTEMFSEDGTVSSLQQPLNNAGFVPDETYAFDLSIDLDRMTIAAAEDADRLAMPIGEWGENETYVVDNFAQLLPDSDLVVSEHQQIQLDRQIAQIDRLFDAEGETYVVDDFGQILPDLDSVASEHPQSQLDRQIAQIDRLFDAEGETYVVDDFGQILPDLDPIGAARPQAQLDRLFESELDAEGFISTQAWEEGETYAIDLGNLYPSEAQIDTDLDLRADRHLLSDLDSSLFPVIGGEDEPEDDPDTQTTTDIFGHSAQQQERAPSVPAYEENATNTSLMAAAIDGDLDLVQQAIEAGANLDRYDWNLGYSPLGMAIDRGHPEVVQCLLAAAANPHNGSTSTTALGLAAERGESEIVQMLLPRGIDVNAPVGRDGWTALLAAIKNGHRAVVQLLVTAGANVNAWSQGETPILFAAKCEEREIYQYLYPLVNTAIRLCADRDGEQLLQATRKRRIREQNRPVEKFIEMATVGNLDEVNRAIEVGIEIDELGAKGHTALMAAAYHGHRSIVNTLLSAGADPNLLSDDDGLGTAGMTALMLAAGSFFASNRQQILQLLIAGGAEIDQRGAGGKTAIFYAALAGSGYADCVEVAIAAGADLNLQDDRGHTVLSAVAAAENYGMFNLLMQAGASTAGLGSIQLIQAAGAGNVERVKSLLATNVNLDLDRGAAISNAAAAGHTAIVELLIKAGANVNLRDKLGFTPIASAAYAGYGQIVQLLIDAGADTQAPAGEANSYSALEYAQMGLYQFPQENLQHAQIVRILQQVGAR